MQESNVTFVSPEEDSSLSEVLDRLLEKGVVISGDIIISVADTDLVYIGLRALLTTVDAYEALIHKKIDQLAENKPS